MAVHYVSITLILSHKMKSTETDHFLRYPLADSVHLPLSNTLYRVRINYRRILQNHIFTKTEQKYMMLLPFEKRNICSFIVTLNAFDLRTPYDTADVQALFPFPPDPLKHVRNTRRTP